MSPPLDILFEDDALLFINKPAGVVFQQRMHQPDEPYLEAEVARHTAPAYLMQRLDRETSGVMFFSKRGDLNAQLTRQFKTKRIRKRYLAICDDRLAEPRTIDAPLARVAAIKFDPSAHQRAPARHRARPGRLPGGGQPPRTQTCVTRRSPTTPGCGS